MSWEGYERCICPVGHYWVNSDCQFPRCPYCSQVASVVNVVDQTNGCEENVSDGTCICGERELILLKEAVFDTCNLGHQHVVEPALYKGFGKVNIHTGWRTR